MLPKEATEEFKKLYSKIFHKDLDDAEASRRANNVLDFYKAVYLPIDTENVIAAQCDEQPHRN